MNWKDVGKRLSKLAPTVGTALGGPAGGLIGAVVASRLGVEPTPAALEAALSRDPAAYTRLRELDTELAKAQLVDIQQAREMHRESIMPSVLTLLVFGAWFAATAALYFIGLPVENRELVYAGYGALSTEFARGMSYWLGSSRGSADKQAMIERLK